MTTTAIREKLIDYILHVDDKKVEAFYTIVENDLQQVNENWSEDFKTEMNRRLEDYKEGKAKMYSWEEIKDSLKK